MNSSLYDGPICDPHIHFFALNELKYEWLKGPNQAENHPFLKEKINNIRHPWYLEDLKAASKGHNVVKFVHVQAESADPIGEAKFCESVAATNPEVGGIVPYADFTSDTVDDTLSTYSHLPHVKGIRQLLNWHHDRTDLRDTPTNYAADEQWVSNYALLQKYGYHYEFHGFPRQLFDAVKIAERYPNIPMVINHSGLIIDFSEAGVTEWKNSTKQLAAMPNVYIKLSGLAMISHDYTAESISPFIHYLISVFGVGRCMFASNYPVEKAVTTYDQLYTTFKQTVAHLSKEDQKKLFYDNAMSFYRL